MAMEEIPDKEVSQLMTRYVLMVEPDLTVWETMEKMMEKSFRCVIVARMSPYKELGLVTRFDIMAKVMARGKDPLKVEIAQIMEKPLHYIDHNSRVKEASRIMGENQICNLPVKKGNNVVGVISSTDIFKEYLEK